MVNGRRRDQWQHTARVLMLMHNCNVNPREGQLAKFADYYPFELEAEELQDQPDVLTLKEFFQ